jgi:bifunctional N-acetylglucosamine-1-phosphate-uridyltransferase/glucosamine-1-phosphate-acetyltransferase GlmU-like protein
MLRDTVVGAGATVIDSFCEGADIDEGAEVGPFAHVKGGRVT